MNDFTSNDMKKDELVDTDIQELMRRTDGGEILTKEECQRLSGFGRCSNCGKLPDTESIYAQCEGFHRQQDSVASESSEDSGHTSSQATSSEDPEPEASASSKQDPPSVDDTDSQQTDPDHVREYLNRGWSPIPLKPSDKAPRFTGWQSRTFGLDDFAENDNVGLKLGPASRNLVDVDLDSYEGVLLAPRFLPKTGTIFGRRSKPLSHHLYELDPEDTLRLEPYTDVDGTLLLEVRGDGHQTMVPESIHPWGERVEWSRFDQPTKIALADLNKATGRLAAAAMLGRHWQGWEHKHHMIALSLAGGLMRAGWSEEAVLDFVEAVCFAGQDDDWEDRRKAVESTAEKLRSGDKEVVSWLRLTETVGEDYVKKLHEWLQIPRTPKTSPNAERTDTGNANRLVQRHGKDLRYCDARGGYHVWNGRYWAYDETGVVVERTKDTMQAIFEEAAKTTDDSERAALSKHAASSLNRSRIEAALKLAQSDPAIAVTPDEFDRDPYLLNVENGTLGLKTGGLLSHRREDLMTKLVPVPYDPQATAWTWRAFLDRVTERDLELQAFLQRVAGYCLTGDVSEQVFFFLYGEGQNGKSKFVEALQMILGDYARKLPPGVLMKKKYGSNATDFAQLPGVRLAVTNETAEGGVLDDALIKDLTGGDRLVGRLLFHEPFEFAPTHKIVMYGNDRPKFTGTDKGIRRRPLLVPFDITIPDHERDNHLAEKFARELPGILRWAVEGCLNWQEQGLNPPERVRDATAEYIDVMDVSKRFIDECTKPGRRVHRDSLYAAYTAWSKSIGESAKSRDDFIKDLTRQGIPEMKSNNQKYRTGIELKPEWAMYDALRGLRTHGSGKTDGDRSYVA